MNALDTWVDDSHRYLLGTRIATGGMGEVWRATDTALGRQVAVKLLKAEFADDPLFRQRFESEARHAAALTHPGIAAVYDVGESALVHGTRRPYLVMELVEGQPLNNLLRPGAPMNPDAVRDLLAQVGDALGAAHRAGIVHRDVKPGNLLVTPDRQVKVTDFGIARAADAVAMTQTGQVMGTPQYLSPEQAEGKRAEAPSDVYALGVVAYECLAGRRPFEADSPVATALAHLRNPVPPLPDEVPADLRAVVYRALEKDPAKRFANGSEFAAALRDPATAAIGLPGAPGQPDDDATTMMAAPTAVVAPIGATQVVPAQTDAVPLPPEEPPVAEEKKEKSWLPAVLVGLLVLVLALGGFAWWMTQGDKGDETPNEQPTSSASPTEDPEDEVETVDVDPDEYVGRDVDAVVTELEAMGLRPAREALDNPGGERQNRVVSVNPSGTLEMGDRITVTFWGAPPAPTPTPTPEPTEPTATETPTVPDDNDVAPLSRGQ